MELLSNAKSYHLIAVPSSEDSLRLAIGEAHRRYTRRINFREKWRGYLWQGRFASFVMDEPYLPAAARYVELNPLRARLVTDPCDWPWSSARAHLAGRDDQLVKVAPLLAMIGDWDAFLRSAMPEDELRDIRRHARHRSAARGRGIPRALGGHDGPCTQAAETRSKTKRNNELSHVSPELKPGRDDQLVKVAPLLAMIGDWDAFLRSAMPEDELRDIRRHARTGRPLGDEAFLARLEDTMGRALKPQKRGPKPKETTN